MFVLLSRGSDLWTW